MTTLPQPPDLPPGSDEALIPAVIYAAKSTDDLRGSIETQIADCEAMAMHEGWNVVGVYYDEAASAYHGNRGAELARARAHAERLVVDHSQSVLVVQHTDRLARGDGIAAQHLVEILLWARKAGVRIRSVQDDSTGENLLMAVVMGERNHEDSRRKAAATSAGRRRAAERGEPCGSVPDGYMVERTAHGAMIARTVLKNPERIEVYTLLWDMAREGATVIQIVAELARRGYRTAPYHARPRSFTATRVGQVWKNCFYAGLMRSRGEIIGNGNWQAYVDPDEWYRLQRERSGRARHRSRPVGRPQTGLLAGLARCECGGAMIVQRAGRRKDGSRRRTYVCREHMHSAGACLVRPFDATEVERTVVGGLDKLLIDADSWADALLAGREAEIERLTTFVQEAANEVARCERRIEELTARYDRAQESGDEAEIALAKRAWEKHRKTAARAEIRQRAAEDALVAASAQADGDSEAMRARTWQSLFSDLDAVKQDRAALNQALRRWFSDFVLRREDGELRIVPILSEDAANQLFTELGEDRAPADAPAISVILTPPGQTPGLEDGRIIGYDDDPVIAGQRFAKGRCPISVATEVLTAESVGQSDMRPPYRLPHNTQPGSWRGTAGGSPRRSRTAPPARSRL